MEKSLSNVLSLGPIVPALRGITPADVVGIAEMLLDEGVRVFEVPMRTKNPTISPIEDDALRSLEILRDQFHDRGLVVAGSVMHVSDLDVLGELGIDHCFSLNVQPGLIKSANDRGISFVPGIETVSEAISAAQAGANGLKLFPAVIREPDGTTCVRLSPGYIAYLNRFLSLPLIPAGNSFEGGVASAFLESGAAGINVGAQLYQPGISVSDLRERLRSLKNSLKG